MLYLNYGYKYILGIRIKIRIIEFVIHTIIHTMENFNDRLDYLIKKQASGKQKQFSIETGIPYSSLNEQLHSDKKKPKSEFLEKIKKAYPLVNMEWLVTGEGEPFLKPNQLNHEEMLRELQKLNDALKEKVSELSDKVIKLQEMLLEQKEKKK
jgi:hypothetical protein